MATMRANEIVFIRIGLCRYMVPGVLESIDTAAGMAVVVVGRERFARSTKRVYANTPKNHRIATKSHEKRLADCRAYDKRKSLQGSIGGLKVFRG